MDNPALEAHQHQAALQALARIHVVSRTVTQIVSQLMVLLRATAAADGKSLRILDIACGGGELTTAVATRMASRTSSRVEVIGLDMSDRAMSWATRNHARTTKNLDISFRTCDVLNDELPSCTLAFHSLFLHHLDDAQAVAQLETMASATRVGFVFSDLL
ncbi:MAG: methyltransferase domain-containing protein, partial [Fuerstiella sp.]|nr:methyltransferase domain-containing protein [Fuerstiella sp.]